MYNTRVEARSLSMPLMLTLNTAVQQVESCEKLKINLGLIMIRWQRKEEKGRVREQERNRVKIEKMWKYEQRAELVE